VLNEYVTKMPDAFRQHATWYTDQEVVYAGVMSAAQHLYITKTTVVLHMHLSDIHIMNH
jgi:hypothetical protein